MGVIILTTASQIDAPQSGVAVGAVDGGNPPDIGVQSPELNSTKRSLDERTSASGHASY